MSKGRELPRASENPHTRPVDDPIVRVLVAFQGASTFVHPADWPRWR